MRKAFNGELPHISKGVVFLGNTKSRNFNYKLFLRTSEALIVLNESYDLPVNHLLKAGIISNLRDHISEKDPEAKRKSTKPYWLVGEYAVGIQDEPISGIVEFTGPSPRNALLLDEVEASKHAVIAYISDNSNNIIGVEYVDFEATEIHYMEINEFNNSKVKEQCFGIKTARNIPIIHEKSHINNQRIVILGEEIEIASVKYRLTLEKFMYKTKFVLNYTKFGWMAYIDDAIKTGQEFYLTWKADCIDEYAEPKLSLLGIPVNYGPSINDTSIPNIITFRDMEYHYNSLDYFGGSLLRNARYLNVSNMNPVLACFTSMLALINNKTLIFRESQKEILTNFFNLLVNNYETHKFDGWNNFYINGLAKSGYMKLDWCKKFKDWENMMNRAISLSSKASLSSFEAKADLLGFNGEIVMIRDEV